MGSPGGKLALAIWFRDAQWVTEQLPAAPWLRFVVLETVPHGGPTGLAVGGGPRKF